MAILRQGILGGISGRVGNVVGSSWKGIPILKTRPLSVANPRTNAQVEQRDKMSTMVKVGSEALNGFVRPLWDRFASRMSGFNAFISANIQSLNASAEIVPATFRASRGRMLATPIVSAEVSNVGADLDVTWSVDILDSFQSSTDVPYVLAVSVSGDVKVASAGEATRASALASFSALPGKTLEAGDVVFLAFRRVDGTVVSNSSFLLATI